MDDTDRITIAVIAGTVLVLSMLFFVVMLLVVNANRRHKHRAELAELKLQRDREVMLAEREATRQTLREVGRDLHDNVGQLLTVVQLGLNTLIDRGDADTRLSAARDALDQGVDEVRRLGRSLNDDLWEKRSLAEAIQAEAVRLERVGHVKAHVLVNGGWPELPKDSKTILFRVFQEILSNALRHGGADVLEIVLGNGKSFALSITDNGHGFDPGKNEHESGLLNIRRRCRLIGFEARCTSAPGKGCSWHILPAETHGT